MKNKQNLISALLLGLVFSCSAIAQERAAAAPITAGDRDALFQTLDRKLRENYVFPDVAERIIKALGAKAAKGAYASADNTKILADMLSHDLREFGDDAHFRVFSAPDFHEEGPDSVPTAEDMAKERINTAQMGFGIQRVERLPGNVGYLEVRGFGPTEFVGPAFSSALSLLSGTDALILDLRRNGGGQPSSVAYLMSHFFAEGDERHLNDLYFRPKNETQQYWTNSAVVGRYTKPVYVLISGRTFSGGEECAYDFQTQKRATLVGETTGGGANPGDGFSLGNGLVVFIPTGRAINPITHTNWEHVGVKPDIAVPAAQAQQTAYVAILRALLPKATDPEERENLKKTLALAEKGESEPPVYTLRH
ncbi:MAG TPA: S41 family peptidase [Burkholderiaceae bacterium]|jgi:hypothetical protein|nr:S41 family peptidase [Burkholderiaceae bacterium]